MKVTWKWFLSLIGSLFILFAGLRCGSHISSTDTAALTAALTAASSITFTEVTTTSITVNWRAAVDTSNPSKSLTYLLYYTQKKPGGIKVSPAILRKNWIHGGITKPDTLSTTVSALTPNTLYYFSILVTDASKNTGVSTIFSQATAEALSPTLSSLVPATNLVNPLPKTIVAIFSEAMSPLSVSNFSLSGTCATLPTTQAVAMSTDGTTATLSLSDGTCLDTQTLMVSLDPTTVTSAAGVAGTGTVSSNTYTLATTGPLATVGTPSSTVLTVLHTATVTVKYAASASGNPVLTSALTASGGGITLTPLTGTPSCTVAVDLLTTPSSPIITLSGCSGTGTFTVHVDAGTATDPLGNLSATSAESALITVDNTAPTLDSLFPATSYVNPTPTSILATFSKAMHALPVDNFVLTGTCSSLPTKGTVTMGGGNMIATLSLSGGSCTNGQTLSVAVNPTALKDTLENSGTGSTITRTYTVDTVGPSAFLGAPSLTTFHHRCYLCAI